MWLCCCLALSGFTQEGVTTFGMQLKPVIPFSFFGPVTTFDRPALKANLELTGGMAFGMVIRAGLGKSLAIETGINQITRRYKFDLANDTNGYTASSRIRFVGYEVPVMLLAYIRTGERTWLNTALGFSIDMYPSDALVSEGESQIILLRKHWARFGVVGNLGLEYRTESSGYFYFGATFHRPFNDMVQADALWYDGNVPYRMVRDVTGAYLTMDIRYFFHEPPERARKRKPKK